MPLCGRAVEILEEADSLRRDADMTVSKLVKERGIAAVPARVPLVVPRLGLGADEPLPTSFSVAKYALARPCRICGRSKLKASLPQRAERPGKIVLHNGTVRRPLVNEYIEGAAIGVGGLFQALGSALPLAQGLKGITEVVLRRGPIERHTLTRTFLEGGAVSSGLRPN